MDSRRNDLIGIFSQLRDDRDADTRWYVKLLDERVRKLVESNAEAGHGNSYQTKRTPHSERDLDEVIDLATRARDFIRNARQMNKYVLMLFDDCDFPGGDELFERFMNKEKKT